MFYNKTNKKFKSMGVAKIGVVSCALLGNSILAGCANSGESLMMNKTSQQLTERSDSGDNITDLNSGSKKNNSGATEKGSCGKVAMGAFAGLAVGSLAFGLGFGLPWTERGHEIEDFNQQVAYLVSQNMALNNSLQNVTGISAAQSAQIANLTDANAVLNQNLTAAAATNAQLSATLNSTISDMNDITQPDHFKTLNATIALQNGTNVALNYSNFINYFGKSNSLNLTIDQTSSIDMNSIPIVATSLEPSGALNITLLPTNKNICGNNIMDLSGFTGVTGITINGELYIPIIGPPNVADFDTATAGSQASYDLASGFYNLENLQACAGGNSYIRSSDNPFVPISDSTSPSNPIVGKLDGVYAMQFNDLQVCYSDLLNSTGFLAAGSMVNGISFASGNFIKLQGVPSNSVLYDLAANSMTNLTYVYIGNAALSGNQITDILGNINNGVVCIQLSSIQGDVTVPAGVNLNCTNFYSTSNLVSGMPSSYLLSGSLLVNSLITINGTGTASTRVSSNVGWYVPSNAFYYTGSSSSSNNGGGNPVPFIWSNGTSLGSAYAFTNGTTNSGHDLTVVNSTFVGECAVSA